MACRDINIKFQNVSNGGVGYYDLADSNGLIIFRNIHTSALEAGMTFSTEETQVNFRLTNFRLEGSNSPCYIEPGTTTTTTSTTSTTTTEASTSTTTTTTSEATTSTTTTTTSEATTSTTTTTTSEATTSTTTTTTTASGDFYDFYIGGTFTNNDYNRISRLNFYGAIDNSFNDGSVGFNEAVNSFVEDTDGTVWVAGNFTQYRTSSTAYIAKIAADGSGVVLDTSSGFDGEVLQIVRQSDGKIIAVGNFTTYRGTNVSKAIRINTNGTLDAAININGDITSVGIQADGKIILGGYIPALSESICKRFNTDLSEDATFSVQARFVGIKSVYPITSGAYNGSVWVGYANQVRRHNSTGGSEVNLSTNGDTLAFEYDYSTDITYIAGAFTDADGENNRIIGVNTSGIRVRNFGTGFDNTVKSLSLYNDGSTVKLVAAGSFTTFKGVSTPKITMLQVNDGGTDRVDGFASANWDGTINVVRLSQYQFGPSTTTTTTTVATTTSTTTTTTTAASGTNNVVLVGSFMGVDAGFNRLYMARLTSDGTLSDENVNDNINNEVYVATEIPSSRGFGAGYFYFGGIFTNFRGTGAKRIARVNALAGSEGFLVDNTFGTNPGFDGGPVNCIAVASNGVIGVGGAFTSYKEISRNNFALVNEDASIKSMDYTTWDGAINAVVANTDNSFIFGGASSTVYKVLANGNKATGWNVGVNGVINDIALQSDGKFIVVGAFTQNNDSTAAIRHIRYNADGTVDAGFNRSAGCSNTVNCVAVDGNGNIYEGFIGNLVHNQVYPYFAAFNDSGNLRTSFLANVNANGGFNGIVKKIRVQADGKLIVMGDFTEFNGNVVGGLANNGIVRLNTDGTYDATFNTNHTYRNGDIIDIALITS